jgi:hypothetical protein
LHQLPLSYRRVDHEKFARQSEDIANTPIFLQIKDQVT